MFTSIEFPTEYPKKKVSVTSTDQDFVLTRLESCARRRAIKTASTWMILTSKINNLTHIHWEISPSKLLHIMCLPHGSVLQGRKCSVNTCAFGLPLHTHFWLQSNTQAFWLINKSFVNLVSMIYNPRKLPKSGYTGELKISGMYEAKDPGPGMLELHRGIVIQAWEVSQPPYVSMHLALTWNTST